MREAPPAATRSPLVRLEPFRRPARWRIRRWASRVFGQPVRTIVVVMAWLAVMIPYVRAVSLYVSYDSALLMGVGLAVFSGIAVHLWPPRTAPWRTVAWAAIASAVAGAHLLLAGAGRFALTGSMLIGLVVVLLRIDSNGRRVIGMYRTWRSLR